MILIAIIINFGHQNLRLSPAVMVMKMTVHITILIFQLYALYLLFHSLSVWLTVSDALYVLAYINCNSIAFGKPKCGQVHYTFNLMLICHLFDIDLTLIWHWFDIDLILICDWFWNDFGLFRWQLTICYCLQVVMRLILDGFEFDQLMDDWNWEWKNWNTKEC